MADIKLYTTRICPYCVRAKTLLKSLELEFEEVDLTNDPELRLKLSQENQGYRTVPMIFVKDQFIGGFTELHQLHKSGQLETLLNA